MVKHRRVPGEDPGTEQQGKAQQTRTARPGPDMGRKATAEKPDRSRTQAEILTDLNAQIAAAGDQFFTDVAGGHMMAKAADAKARLDDLDYAHRRYAGLMCMAVLNSLDDGLEMENVVKAATMGAVMWAMSPVIRDQVTVAAASARQAQLSTMHKIVDARRERKPGEPEEKWRKRAEKWDRRAERIGAMVDGDRIPYTPYSAALTEVGLNEQAYRLMRQPGADVQEIFEAHQDMMADLYAMAESDGVDRSDIEQGVRVIVMQKMQSDPTVRSSYSELAYGLFDVSKPKQVKVNDRVSEVWDGTFVRRDGATSTHGSFNVRVPMNSNEHALAMSSMMSSDMRSCRTATAVDSVMTTYMVGMAMHKNPQALREMDMKAHPHVARVCSVITAMQDDGLDDAEIQMAYSSAFMDALDKVRETNPNLEHVWAQKFGHDWLSRVNDIVRNPNDVADQMRRYFETRDQASRGEAQSEKGDRGSYADTDHEATYRTSGRHEPGADGQSRRMKDQHSFTDRAREASHRASRNQRYNKAETGRVFGLGPDDADLTTPGHDEPEPG